MPNLPSFHGHPHHIPMSTMESLLGHPVPLPTLLVRLRLQCLQLSDSQKDFASSRILKCHQISIIRLLLLAFMATVGTVVWGENYIKMVELTSMLSLTMDAFGTLTPHFGGMYEGCIQTCAQYRELLGRLTTTPANMRTLYTTVSLTPTDLGNLLLAAKEVQEDVGRTSQMLQLKTNFLKKSRQMIRDLWLSLFETSWDTRSGDIQVFEDSTPSPRGSPSLPRSPPSLSTSWDNVENIPPVSLFFPLGCGSPATHMALMDLGVASAHPNSLALTLTNPLR